MKIDWSTCQCCGQPAKQRQFWITKYHPTMDGIQNPRLYVADHPVRMLPDLCDKCCCQLYNGPLCVAKGTSKISEEHAVKNAHRNYKRNHKPY